ncbi:MAG: GAF domain-containing sensor histidine kinase [Bacillota bacterium]
MADIAAWYLPLIAVGVGFHLAVSWALLWRYFQARERSLLTWGLAWLVLTVHVLGMFLTHMGFADSAPLLRDVSFAAASLAFLAGQVERSGRSPRSLRLVSTLAAGALLLALVAGIIGGNPVGLTAAAVVGLSLAGAAWLSFPAGQDGKIDIPQWLLFAGYVVGAAHAVLYALPVHAVGLEIGGHALFSLFFSAAVTWQSWEHQKAVRLFSRTLERLNRPLTTQEALDEALSLVAETLSITEGWIILRTEGRGDASGEWTIGAAYGFPGFAERGVHAQRFPIERCLCLRHVDHDVLVTQVRDLACVRASQEVGQPAGRHVTIPLGQDGKVAGIMSLMVPAGRFFTPADKEILNALGEQIGLAIDRARLYDQLKEKEEARGRLLARLITAQEDERRRIARELHDETGQALTALVVNLDFLVRHPIDEGALRARLAEVREMAEATLAEVRRVIHEMRPTVLDDLGLEAAIRWLVKRYEPGGLKIKVELSGLNGRLPDHVEITVFRVIQEACTNTVKHASAVNLKIRVVRRGHWLTVEVTDDGKGFDPAQRERGMGLPGLRERVTLAGGTLSIESGPTKGTRVFAELPLGGAVHDDDSSADLRRPHDGSPGRPHGTAVGTGH